MPDPNALPKRSESHGGKCHSCGLKRVRVRRMANLDIQTRCMACGTTDRYSIELSGPEGCKAEMMVREQQE